MEHLPLDGKTQQFIEQRLAQINALQSELNGALSLLIEQNGLGGNWKLDWPNRRLVPMEEQALKAIA